jgi:hypothetical protein
MGTNYVDIPGLVAIEKNYVMNSSVLSDGDHNGQLVKINNQMTKLQNLLTTNDGEGIILGQNEMAEIVNNESARLAKKQESIDAVVASQNRLITLNTNYSKRYAEYIKMTLVVAGGLVIIGVLVFLGVGSGIITVVGIVVGSIVMIYCALLYANILSRDNVYFDELNFDSMMKPPAPTRSQNNGGLYNLAGSFNPLSCYGADCCSVGMEYDSITDKCKMSVPLDVVKKDGFQSKNKEMPYSPNEYDSYHKI